MNERLLNYYNGDTLAADTWYKKYRDGNEIIPDDMHSRMAKEFARIEEKYIASEKEDYEDASFQAIEALSEYCLKRQNLTEEKILSLFKDFKYIIPQGRVMAGLGVMDSYRSLSNCLRLPPPKDSYSSILYTDTMLVNAAKRGCGYGLGLSNLRPDGTMVSNAAKSSTGAASFMERFSFSTREVAQKGRRGACLLDMDINHPDILQFIEIKEDLTKVTGANISVKLNDEFMEAVEKDEDYILRFPTETELSDLYWACDADSAKVGFETFEYNELYSVNSDKSDKLVYIKRIKAKEYWDKIIKNARDNAEPGLFYWDTVQNYDPASVYEKYKIDGTNACGEQPMAVFDTCRLILLNLYSFVKNPFTPEAEFDFELLYKMAYEQLRLGDDLVDLEIEYIDRILGKIESDPLPDEEKAIELALWRNVKDMAESGRRVGCGITALGDTLAALGISYDSEEGLAMTEQIMRTKMRGELDATTDLAILRGTFKGWDSSLEMQIKMDSHSKPVYGKNKFYDVLLEEFPEEGQRMFFWGRRNVNWSTIAPAGSTSIVAKTKNYPNLSSGCEPNFMPYYMRKTKVNPGDKNVRVDYVDDNGDSWMEYPVMMGAYKEWMDTMPIAELDKSDSKAMEHWFALSPWYKSTANDISWKNRIRMQAILQRYTTSAISSTLNLPSDVSIDVVSDIYIEGWKRGLKGVTIYRDGSRIGVLTKESTSRPFTDEDAVKRPKILKADSHWSTSKGIGYHVLVGLMDKKPYEVFIDDSDNRYSSKGKIDKESRGKYVFKNGGDPVEIRDFMNPEQQAITRLTSLALRHRIHIKYVVEQLQKIDGDMFGFTPSLARVLKKYIKDGEKSTILCQNPDCTGDRTNVIFEEGCAKCRDCGSSKCG